VCGVQAQLWDAAKETVRQKFERDNYTASEMQRARDEVRLTKERVELERKTQLLAREYVEYNANVTAYLNYNFAKSPSANLYLPVPAGLIDPNATGLFIPAECYPTSSVSTASSYNPNRVPTLAPAFQPGYAPSEQIQQQSYPPVPTPAAPQPSGNYTPATRDNNGPQLNGNQTPVNYYNPQFLQPTAP
jgi:hypothetical protein